MFATDHPQRKQYWVDASTVGTLVGQKIAPTLLDRYLAKTGYQSQQTGDKAGPDRPHNLWKAEVTNLSSRATTGVRSRAVSKQASPVQPRKSTSPRGRLGVVVSGSLSVSSITAAASSVRRDGERLPAELCGYPTRASYAGAGQRYEGQGWSELGLWRRRHLLHPMQRRRPGTRPLCVTTPGE